MTVSKIAQIESFLAVARLHGFRPAARELETSPSAVSQAVANLEGRLGARLFNRSTRSVVLTEAGERYLQEVAPAVEAIKRAGERLREHGSVPTGVLRLNTSILWAQMILQPLVLEYLRRHPQMNVELITEGALVDVIGKGFDAGIRINEAVPSDMIAIPITDSMRSLVVAAPAYLKGRQTPKVPQDLLEHQCIRARMASGRIFRWEFEKRGQSLNIDVPGRLTLDEGGLIRDAASCGAGLAQLPEHWIAEDLAAGRLVNVLKDWTPPYAGLCLYYPSRKQMPAKLRAFIEMIRETPLE